MSAASSPSGHIAPLTDRLLVDTVVYLASLSSQSDTIDRMLDPLRYITARWQQTEPLKQADRVELQRLVVQLKDYLIYRDPLRAFTEQSLEERLQANLQHKVPEAGQRSIGFAAVVVASCGVAMAAFIMPFTFHTRQLLAAPAFLLVSIIGTVWFYLTSLVNFKPELKRVFTLLCTGTVLLGLLFVHFVLIQLLGWGEHPIFRYGGLLIIATVAVGAMYAALYLYARMLNLRGLCMSRGLIAVVAIIGMAGAAAVSLAMPVRNPGYFGFALGSLLLLNVLSLFAAGVARSIYLSVTAAYASSMRWLYIFMAGTFAGSLAYGGVLVWQGHLSGSLLSAALGLFAVPPVLLLLYSGYSFKRETSR